MRKLQIQVLTRDGRKATYETDRSRNVGDLKKHIGRTLNVPMAFSRLTYKGRLLANESILEDEGVKRMSTLELYWQPLVLTPKQLREREQELDKLDHKQRHVTRTAENFEQNPKKIHRERTPSGLRWSSDQALTKRSLSIEDLSPLARQLHAGERCAKEEHSSNSSEELDFLSAYWCCDTGKRNSKDTITESSGGTLAPDSSDRDGASFLNDLLDQRCSSGKHQPFRTGMGLTTGRMSRSIISHIRKNQKNCKK